MSHLRAVSANHHEWCNVSTSSMSSVLEWRKRLSGSVGRERLILINWRRRGFTAAQAGESMKPFKMGASMAHIQHPELVIGVFGFSGWRALGEWVEIVLIFMGRINSAGRNHNGGSAIGSA